MSNPVHDGCPQSQHPTVTIRTLPGAEWTRRFRSVVWNEITNTPVFGAWKEGMSPAGKPEPERKSKASAGDRFYATLRKLGYQRGPEGDYR